MEFTKPRATLAETLEFANLVREAGGGDAIEALMPGIPTNPRSCLIARNLNFSCRVHPSRYRKFEWVMGFRDRDLRDKIAKKLNLGIVDAPATSTEETEYQMLLPFEIGRVAKDYDLAATALSKHPSKYSDEYKERVREFIPYIEVVDAIAEHSHPKWFE